MLRHFLSGSTVFFCLVLTSACGSGPADAPSSPPSGRRVDPATTGAISGRVGFEGQPPARTRLRMGSDPACVAGAGPNPQSNDVLVAEDGALQNVFVYIKDGIDPEYVFETPADPVVLDQKGCVYTPRVLGIRVNQPLAMSNSDATFHNVHALPATNREFNHGLAPGIPAMRSTFTAPEVMVRFKCDVHGWMAAFVGVVAHPFFAVTGSDGSFALTGVPPGTYTVEAWHERFGTEAAQATVKSGAHETLVFSFGAI
jgi:hypothetical protein